MRVRSRPDRPTSPALFARPLGLAVFFCVLGALARLAGVVEVVDEAEGVPEKGDEAFFVETHPLQVRECICLTYLVRCATIYVAELS